MTSLLAVPFDLKTMEMKGGPVSLLENIRSAFLSDSGTLVYIPETSGSASSSRGRLLVWVDREGKEETIPAPPKVYAYPEISPDGTRAAFVISPEGVTTDIWIWDFLRNALTKLTFQGGFEPIWTHDSKKIIYSTSRDGQGGIYWMNADGTGKEEMLYSEPDRLFLPYAITGDGRHLVVVVMVTEGNVTAQDVKLDISLLSMEGDHVLKRLLHDDYNHAQAVISPDNQWIAYTSNEATNELLETEIFIRPFPEVDQGKWQVTTNGGSCPRWSPDGRELIYLGDDNAVMSVAIETDPALSLGIPRKLFQGSYVGKGATEGIPWDIHPDGKRLLMMKEFTFTVPQAGAPQKINVILNWDVELKQRMPVE
jgi:Tol biopolymer transport system component